MTAPRPSVRRSLAPALLAVLLPGAAAVLVLARGAGSPVPPAAPARESPRAAGSPHEADPREASTAPQAAPAPDRWSDGKDSSRAWWAADEIQVVGDPEADLAALIPEARPLERGGCELVARIDAADRGAFARLAVGIGSRAGVKAARPVFYPDEEAWRGRRAGERMFLTRRVAATFPEGADPQAAAARHGARVVSSLSFLPRTFVLEASETFGALGLAAALRDKEGAAFAAPQFARPHALRAFVPNDPRFAEQWHLRNTGQSGGTAGEDIRAVPAWDLARGTGVVVGVVDTGVQHSHPDLGPNYRADLSRDVNDNDADPAPVANSENHGTAVAGCAAARSDNGLGVSGAAPLAGLAAIRLLGAATTDAQDAEAMSHRNDAIHVKSNSWGPDDDGTLGKLSGPLTDAAILNGVAAGRGGKGVVYVWAGGNGRANYDNVNYDGDANKRQVIAVAALDDNGDQTSYSEPGAALLVAAPGGAGGTDAARDILTTDRTGNRGYENGDYAAVPGTSFATPLVAGAAALMLERNPALGWRDVMHLLARTARTNRPADSGWAVNGAGLTVNPKFGHGALDASAAARAAPAWKAAGPEISAAAASPALALPIPDNQAGGVTHTLTVPGTTPLTIEHVEVRFLATHTYRGDLKLTLTSPAGTANVLAAPHYDPGDGYDWTFMTTLCWGESSPGDWTLRVEDLAAIDTGTFDRWELRIYGTPLDTTAPVAGTVNDGAGADIDVQTSTTEISANWTGFSDPDGALGIAGYEWAIGTTPGAADAQPFTDAGLATGAANSSLSLAPGGTYYVTVRARNGSGLAVTATSDGVVVGDTISPAVLGVSSTAADGAYGAGASIPVTVTFSETVLVTGTPRLTLETGAADAVVNYSSGSGTAVLAFSYAVAAGHGTPDLDCVSASALALNGGTIRDSSGNDAVLTLPAPGAAGSLGANKAIVINTLGPIVTGVDSTAPDAAYGAGGTIPVTVAFSAPVIVTGTPRLTLETGAADAVVNYSSGSGSATLTFTYTVAAGHVSPDLDYVSASALALNGGTILDGSDNVAALTLPPPGSANSLAGHRAIVVDTTLPVAGAVNDGAAPPDIDTQASVTTISANWSGFSDPQSGIAGYEWAIGTSAGAADVRPFEAVGLQTRASTSAADATLSLALGATYYVTVRASNGAGLVQAASSDGVVVSTLDAQAPDAPAYAIALPLPQGALVEWGLSPSADVVSYQVWWKPASSPWTEAVLVAGLAGDAVKVPGLVNGTAYDFLVQAVDSSGNESEGIVVSTVPRPLITIDGSGDYAAVQDALAASVAGDTVVLGPGTFAGGVTLPPGVSLAGASPAHTVVEGSVGVNVLTVAGTYLTDPAATIGGLTVALGALGVAAGSADVILDHVVIHHAAGHAASSGAAGRLRAVNCTIVSNGGDGLRALGAAEARNCIAGKNGGWGLNLPSGAAASYNDAWQNASGDFIAGLVGDGNISAAAVFRDEAASDYRDAGASPTVDAGDPADAFVLEPGPNGGRINQGATGNTVWAAAKTPPAGGGGHKKRCGSVGLDLLGLAGLLWLWRRRRLAGGTGSPRAGRS